MPTTSSQPTVTAMTNRSCATFPALIDPRPDGRPDDCRPFLPRSWLALGAAAAVCCAGLLPAQEGGNQIDATRTALAKWVETNRVLSKESQDWALGKEALEARLEVVKREVASLKQRNGEAEASIAEADKKRGELQTESDEKKASAAKLEGDIGELERRTAGLLPRLPEPLRAAVAPLSQRLPKAGEDAKLSLGERYQNVVGILNEVQKWNREIKIASEVRPLGNGSSVEVTVLYLGLGQAYYASADGKHAGIGAPTGDAWVWQPADDRAADIKKAISIYRSELLASFVRLPVRIQ